MAFRLSKDDYQILQAALNVAIDNDGDEWDELSPDDLERAEEIRDELFTLLADSEEEIEEEDEEDDDDDEDEDEELEEDVADED